MTEETREPESNEVARAGMEATAKQRQTGQALVLVGILLLLFDLIAFSFVPSDIRAGHDFWTIIFVMDVLAGAALILIGTIQKARAKSHLSV